MKHDNNPSGWVFVPFGNFDVKIEKLARKRTEEHSRVLANLNRLLKVLDISGRSPYFLTNKWIHTESSGVIAVDQGQSRHRKEFRAYIFPDEQNKALYLLTVGDKNSQEDDNRYCQELIKEIKKGFNNEKI